MIRILKYAGLSIAVAFFTSGGSWEALGVVLVALLLVLEDMMHGAVFEKNGDPQKLGIVNYSSLC